MDMTEREEETLAEIESIFEELDPALALQLATRCPRFIRAGISIGYVLFWTSLATIGMGLLIVDKSPGLDECARARG